MENFFLNFPFKSDTVVPFMAMLEDFELEMDKAPIKPTDPVARVYVNSPGGELAYAIALYHFFDKSRYKYEFVVLESADSCAMLLLLALCPEYFHIYNGSCGMLHQIGYTIETRSLPTDDRFYTKRRLQHLQKTNNKVIDVLKLILNKDEMSLYKEGEDVYLETERLLEIFDKIKSSKVLQTKVKKIFEAA